MATYIVKKTIKYELVKEVEIEDDILNEYVIASKCIDELERGYTEPKILKDTYEIKRKG